MILRQVLNEDLGCASYVVGDASAAAVVDPQLDIAPYLALAERTGLTIRWVLQTHTHADHVSGHAELVERTGAELRVPRAAGWQHPHVPVDDGMELEIGAMTIRALAVPGHRPEHTAYVLVDRTRGLEPWAVLAGDSLLVGDVARPDLAVEARTGAAHLHASLHERLLTLPPACELLPGHLAGSLCGSQALSGKPLSTLAFERAHNALLALPRDAFVDALTAALPERPANADAIVALNRGPGAPQRTSPQPLSVAAVCAAREAGAAVIDTRPLAAFRDGHAAGVYAVPAARRGFASQVAQLLAPEQQIVVVADDAERARAAIASLHAVGCCKTPGWLDGGHVAWEAAGGPVAQLATVSVDALAEPDPAVAIVDVRDPAEYAAGHPVGAHNLPLPRLRAMPVPDGRLLTVCASGRRAVTAASVLAARGHDVQAVVDGGVGDLPPDRIAHATRP